MLLLEITVFILVIFNADSFDVPFFRLPNQQWTITPQPNIGHAQYRQYAPYDCFSSPDQNNCLARERALVGSTPLYNTFSNLRYMQTSKPDVMYPFVLHAIRSYPNKLLQSIQPTKIFKKIVEEPMNALISSLPKANLSIVPILNKGTAKSVTIVSNSDEITNISDAQSRTSEVTTGHTIKKDKVNSVIAPTTLVYEKLTRFDINVTEVQRNNVSLIEQFKEALDIIERKFYKVTFTKLTSSSAALQQQQENGISFVQSGLFLQMFLLAISTQVDKETKEEIEGCIGFNVSDTDRAKIIKEVISDLPKSSVDLVFRWSSRLVVAPAVNITQEFHNGAASALQLHIDYFNETDTSETRAKILNKKIEQDSNGAIHNTFDADDLSGNLSGVMLTTLYLRGRWRSAPTVLNGTRPFHDSGDAPQRTVRMIRINDIMRYAAMTDIDAQAIEVFYATSGLSLLILVPRERSLRNLTSYVGDVGLHAITGRLSKMRIAATLPIYTLRMTLLLPNKLQMMGITRLLNTSDVTSDQLRVSHGIQRIMFWAEAGRNAFKDDGIEWDEPPELEVVIDRPYIFFVRWHNMTLMNGNFVL